MNFREPLLHSEPGVPHKICVVIPTYNEAANIGTLIQQLLGMVDGAEHSDNLRLQLLVVDDNSPDGTGQIVREIAQRDDRVHLLSGPKQGLGQAYTRGFAYVLEHLQVDAVVQMDADFSHAPQDVYRLVQGLADADVVIGSRYTDGGAIDAAWGRRRRWLSHGGNLFARLVAGLYHIRDCTAGFKAIRIEALRRALPLPLAVQGYVFQVACLFALHVSGARLREIPIHFYDRRAGTTKLGWRDIWEFFIHIWWLRLLSKKTFIKFALTGVSGVFVNLGTFWALQQAGVNAYLASPIAIECSIITNFLINNYWTFRDRNMERRGRIRGLMYNAVALMTLGLSFSTFVVLQWLFPEQPVLLSQALSIPPAALANYFVNSYWTFRADKV